MGGIPASALPPRDLWPERIYTLPEHGAYPGRLSSTEELLDRHLAEGSGTGKPLRRVLRDQRR